VPRVKGGNVLSLFPKVDYGSLQHILVPYRRVSTREQADKGAGLDAQRTAMKFGLQMKQAEALNWDCVDRGKSGKNLKRDGLDQTLKLIRSGEAGGLIVSKLDRLSRSLMDFAWLMATAEKEGWNIVALDLGVDLATPAGKAMAGMLAVFAEFERNVISQRTKDGLAEKRDQGVRLSHGDLEAGRVAGRPRVAGALRGGGVSSSDDLRASVETLSITQSDHGDKLSTIDGRLNRIEAGLTALTQGQQQIVALLNQLIERES
jgi:DNA invertase Pin-like site-specific DNA recombinase